MGHVLISSLHTIYAYIYIHTYKHIHMFKKIEIVINLKLSSDHFIFSFTRFCGFIILFEKLIN